jgi:hypothetical protein
MDNHRRATTPVLSHLRKSRDFLTSGNELLSLKLNYRLIVFLYVLVFGIYGWGTYETSSSIFAGRNLLITSIVLLSLCSTFIFREYINSSMPKVRVTQSQFISFLLLLVSAALLNLNRLDDPLSGDELYYARHSQIFSLELIFRIKEIIPNFILNLNSNNVLRLISLLVIGVLILIFRLSLRIRSERVFIILSALFLLVTRQIVQELNANGALLSPLPSFWYFITSSILGFDVSIFRLSSLALFVALSMFIIGQTPRNSYQQKVVLSLIILLFASIPLISFMSVVVEPANMTFLVVVATFAHLVRREFLVSKQVLLLIGMAFYLRMNVGFLFAALLVTHLFQTRKLPMVKKTVLAPLIILLPGLFFTVSSRVTPKISNSDQFLNSIISNLRNTIQSLDLNSALLFLAISLAGVVLMMYLKSSRLFISLYLFFASTFFFVFQFPILSPLAKYPLEYLYPLLFALLFLITRITSENSKALLGSFLVMLGLLNIYGVHTKVDVVDKYRQSVLEGDTFDSLRMMPNVPYPYAEIFATLRELGSPPCLNSGVVYGVFPEIQFGYTVSQMLSAHETREDFLNIQASLGDDWRSVTHSALVEAGIECVILGDVLDQTKTLEDLKKNGWEQKSSAEDTEYGTSVFLVFREVSKLS